MTTRRCENFIKRSVISWLKEMGYETIDRLSLLISESREIVPRKSFDKYKNIFTRWAKPDVLALKNDDVLCVICFENLKKTRIEKSDFYRIIGQIAVCNFYFTGQTFLAIPEWYYEVNAEFLKDLLEKLDVGLLTVDRQGGIKVTLETSSCKFSH